MFAMAALRMFALAGVALFFTAQGSIRGNLRAAVGSNMTVEQIRATVLEEVMGALGSGHRLTDKRLSGIENVLKPTFEAMPKNEHGNLDDAAARYVLHRLFVQRHAMYIRGLEPGGMSWNSTATKEVLEEHIPSFVLGLFEERLKGAGLSMQELTVLAATLEHLIHDEAVERLKVVYAAHDMSTDARVGEIVLQDLIDTYMTIFITGKQDIDAASVAEEKVSVANSYQGWADTCKFTSQVRSGVISSNMAEADFANDNLTFLAATRVVEEIGERYGRWQDSECRDLKNLLLKIEHGSSGRVLLKDFYGAAVNDNHWQFSESVDYLRDLGALDESDPENKGVIIPNYLNAPSNCVASSSIFSVCCIDECDALMAHLERQIGAPEASTDRILEIVAGLPSATVAAPRELPSELRSRLEEIASHHGGFVPLHGRLLGQWLHHAYPRECPYPHVAGTTKPSRTAEYAVQGKAAHATAQEMRSIMNVMPAAGEAVAPVSKALPWEPVEELVASNALKPTRKRSWTRLVVALAAAASFCIAIGRMVMDTFSAGSGGKARDTLLLPYVQKQHAC